MLENTTAFIFKYNDRNIYLLQKDRYNEFIEKGYYDKLTDHYNTPNGMFMLAELYKEEDYASHTLYKFNDSKPYTITRENDLWVIKGKEIEKLL